jgi:hypothetical protein
MQSALETALLLARRCDSYMEGFALRWEIPEFTEADHREIARMEVQARATFESFMRKRGVPRSTTTTDTPSFGWLENAPAGDAFVGSYGRVFDVIVMSRSDKNTTGLHNQAINSGLFESGRPILLAPPSPPDQIGTNVLIAWNRSTEQARVTAFAMPLLQKADRVTVLTVIGGTEVPSARSRAIPNCTASTNSCSRKGLVRNSMAPNFIAWTDIATSLWPLIKMIGRFISDLARSL